MTFKLLSKLVHLSEDTEGVSIGDVLPERDLSFQSISFLTFEAVLEVVLICFAGFMTAKSGILNIQGQKVMSQLNVSLFTPCLIFIKLAPSLSLLKMIDIVVIPIFYAISTGIAYGCSKGVSSILGLNDPETDFVTAMAVFGNSNSLPVSLTLSLAYTLPDLLWDDIKDDNLDKVASRGILYLLIFQQLGQILRWSWGYNKLLRKRSIVELSTYNGYSLLEDTERQAEEEPVFNTRDTSNADEPSEVENPRYGSFANVNAKDSNTPLTTNVESNGLNDEDRITHCSKYSTIQNFLLNIKKLTIITKFLDFMNPPLFAMLISVMVASIPSLQNAFFGSNGSFIQNTVAKSIQQLGSVSIPLILIVLGSNLYPCKEFPPPSRNYSKIIVASLLSRMVLPSFILLPIIALCVKFIKLSILDDPIFLLVAFILTISPPAIQLSQIVQLNEIFQKEMAGVLFWGYVVLTLPTTIFIVVTSLEVLKWAVLA